MINKESELSIKEDMNIVIVGHVDHGKSTIIGRLLADTNSLPDGKLEQVKERCRRNSKPFEYAFLLDALKDEQAQGITIDAARVFFNTKKREYIIIDAPGHIEFLKNMVTGAARAEAALLVIDAGEGIQENSKRHSYLLSMLGIKQIAVVVNKMDLVDYSEEVFNNIVKEYSEFLKQIDVEPTIFIPVSGFFGDNIAALSEKTPWYKDKTVLGILDSFEIEKLPEDKPFRMPVQDVYKFTRDGDSRRIVAGTIETGRVNVGDEVVFYPSGKKSVVKSIEGFNSESKDSIGAGYATGFTLNEQIYVTRGELASIAGQTRPKVTTRIKTNLFWLSKNSMQKGKKYYLKIGTAKVKAEVEEIKRVLDASSLDAIVKKQIDRHDVAEVILKTERAVAFDENSLMKTTSRFVIIDNYDIAGGGIIQEALEDEQTQVREKVLLRNYNWESSAISSEERAEKYSQKSKLILITGEVGTGRRDIAKGLEKNLFDSGKIVYYLGVENLTYGVDADISSCELKKCKEEKVRRFAEIAHLMVDTGTIVIATVVNLKKEELDIIKTVVSEDKIELVLVGERSGQDIDLDLHIKGFEDLRDGTNAIKSYLQDIGVIFKP